MALLCPRLSNTLMRDAKRAFQFLLCILNVIFKVPTRTHMAFAPPNYAIGVYRPGEEGGQLHLTPIHEVPSHPPGPHRRSQMSSAFLIQCFLF